jgi:rhodanese-related sulfurtransferase
MGKRRFFKYGKYKIFIPLLIVLIILSWVLSISGCSAFVNTKEVIPISTEKVNEIIEKGKDYILLDVRTQEEYDSGHLKDAMLIPVDDLEERINEVPEGKPIIVYCKSGMRSARAADILLNNGFSPVYNMQGGIEKWRSDGFFVYGDAVTYNNINIEKVYEIVKDKNSNFQIVDVRSAEEYGTAHIKGAISIPVSDIESNLNLISKDLPVIVYCSSSTCGSSSQAAGIFFGLGFKEVYAMNAGIEEWIEKDYPVEP